jgi:hypothetical protein
MQLHDPLINCSAHLGNLRVFVAVRNAELSNKIAKYKADQKVFAIKTFIILVVLLLLWKDNIVESFCSCCIIDKHYLQDCLTLCNKGHMCDKRKKGRKLSVSVCTEEVSVQHERQLQEVQEKCASFSPTVCDLNQHCMENIP